MAAVGDAGGGSARDASCAGLFGAVVGRGVVVVGRGEGGCEQGALESSSPRAAGFAETRVPGGSAGRRMLGELAAKSEEAEGEERDDGGRMSVVYSAAAASKWTGKPRLGEGLNS